MLPTTWIEFITLVIQLSFNHNWISTLLNFLTSFCRDISPVRDNLTVSRRNWFNQTTCYVQFNPADYMVRCPLKEPPLFSPTGSSAVLFCRLQQKVPPVWEPVRYWITSQLEDILFLLWHWESWHSCSSHHCLQPKTLLLPSQDLSYGSNNLWSGRCWEGQRKVHAKKVVRKSIPRKPLLLQKVKL